MIVVVGGHSRNIGKTSVVCGIVKALADRDWTAVKITQYGHGEGRFAFSEEKTADPRHDSGRYLVAGARKSYWLRTRRGELAEAMPRLGEILAQSRNVIIESNSVLGLLHPDLCYMVLDGGVEDFKPGCLRYLHRADGLVLTSAAGAAWPAVPAELLAGKPRYFAPAPGYENAELIAAIKFAAVSADIPSR